MHRIDHAVRCLGVRWHALDLDFRPRRAGAAEQQAEARPTVAQDGAAVALIDRSWSRDLIVVAGHVILV